VVAPVTSSIRGLPSEVRLGIEHGLKAESVVNLDNVFRVEQRRLGAYVGCLDAETMRSVCRALNIALGCA
jgi:mRNA interferase MazF